MILMHLICRKAINNLSRFEGRLLSPYSNNHRHLLTTTASVSPSLDSYYDSSTFHQNPKSNFSFNRYIHSTLQTKLCDSNIEPKHDSDDSDVEDGTMNEFLSRFVWIMRRKLREVYTECNEEMIEGMLLFIARKVVDEIKSSGLEGIHSGAVATPSQAFSEDLWNTVWEVSHSVLEDMEKARKKEKMKGFLQCEEVKEMCRFAGEIGICGDLLREIRFKWAKEKMEECEFYEGLEHLREEAEAREKEEVEAAKVEEGVVVPEEISKPGNSLPKRHGKMRYKIYGLDLSDPKWTQVNDRIHEAGEIIWDQEPKPISGKCKLVMEKIISLKEEEDPSLLLAEWVELLQPSRIDWINLLNKLEELNTRIYFKVAELVLNEMSYQTNISDYSKLIEAHAKENRSEDVERILKKMSENGILPDILTATTLVHMYSRAGNLDRAKEAFEILRSHGFQPDTKVYYSMIMAYVDAGQPKLGESLMREMEARDMKPSEDIYMALLRAFAQRGDVSGASRISTTMQFAGFQPSLEFCKLLVEAYGRAGDPDQARSNFDYMTKVGHKPDDSCTAIMIAAYEKKNLLDSALTFLLEREKDGFEPGPATYTVLVDWLGKLLLVDEAEQLLGKIAEQGETPSFKVHVSLCDMYLRAGMEKKALQSLGVLEARADQLGPDDFQRIIEGLLHKGFLQDARRIHRVMEAHGFAASEKLKGDLMASQYFKQGLTMQQSASLSEVLLKPFDNQ
ncbi:PPR domain-containing protein/PPR_3 domain-containing protein [Cephalotus follicularis]|uniref:PPR domain-containing protein/PPR_3 domain-containing protein n=1 Tax=Cephalotus follicularis TaxID=3775 RepID=A0A1Q3CAL6_CEPFO|nr:PPR domain-containing protein/PPR_3 domain-containing protein [Cephalotus follicularis]